MANTKRTVEGKIMYSIDAPDIVKGLVSENSGHLKGDLELELNGEWLSIKFTGREDISSELERYIQRVNYDETHEAIMAVLEFGRQG